MTEPTTRTLVLLRHAKSDWPTGVADHERPLADRGRADAPVAGDWIREYVGVPDLAVVSTAVRTRQTWDLVAARLGAPVPVRYDDAVYDASASRLLTVVRGTDDEVATLMLVGHNPGTADLAAGLAAFGDDADRARMLTKYPTCGVAVLRFDRGWREVAPQTGELVDFVVPRG